MCIFCDIVDGKIPARVVLDRPDVLAFHDSDPKAPVHVLVIPKKHIASALVASDDDRETLGTLLLVARDVALQLGMQERGCRFVVNTGSDGGQSVDHLHIHVLGGRKMTWPPG